MATIRRYDPKRILSERPRMYADLLNDENQVLRPDSENVAKLVKDQDEEQTMGMRVPEDYLILVFVVLLVGCVVWGVVVLVS